MRIIICDDDVKLCEQYVGILKAIFKDNQIPPVKIEFYHSGKMLLEQWRGRSTDILFLDINMPEKNGIEVAYELREKGYQGQIIFLTVSNQHGIEAFDVEAFHYLVKGDTDYARIEKVFLNVYADILEKERKYITLSRGSDLRKIAVDSIYYFEIKNRRMTVHYKENESFSFYSTIERIEKELKYDGFVRVHQGYLVAMMYSHKSKEGKEINIANGDRVPIGIRYANKYEEALKERSEAC